jgi:hypothetical protein
MARTVTLRSSPDTADIRSALRLRQRKTRAQRAVGQTRQQTLLLLVRAASNDAADGRPLDQQQISRVVANPPEFLDRDAGKLSDPP